MTNPEIDEDGTKCWYNERAQRHRIDGPAIEWENGSAFWYRNGKLHRYDGPAIIYGGGGEIWFVNGKRIDIKPILERLDISPDWKSWSDEEKFLVRLALP